MVGQVLANRYRVVRLLGEGAMGQVWLVEDTTTGGEVALKVISQKGTGGPGASGPLRPDGSSNPNSQGSLADKSQLEFIQEFRLMTQLRHQNCCEVLDYGLLPDDSPYMTMEVVPGQGLDELGPVAGAAFDRLFSQILLALGYIHARGVVHCDLKAANVRVRDDGVVKLMDYGLMEYAGQSGGPIKGTLGYLAPEMIKRGLIDQRTDLYAVGVLGFEMLTGRWPFLGDKPSEILRAHVSDDPPRLSTLLPGVDPRHERVIRRLMAKEPIDRYQSADAVLEDLGFAIAPGLGGNLLTSPLMGRAPEMAKLFVQLARITSGKKGGVLLVAGPAGIGKSRLLKEFSFNARLENLPYAEGANHEFARTPYGPIMQILRGLLPALREWVPEELTRLAPVLVKLLPELETAPAPDLDAGNEKQRLQTAIATILRELSAKRGTVVVLEDMQWADPLTREVLELVLRTTKEASLLVLLTARAIEGNAGWAEHVTRLTLGPLGDAGLRKLVSSMLGTPEVESLLLERLGQLSGGNPQHVEMLLEHLVRSGLLVKEHGSWALTGELSAAALPDGLRGLLARKVSDLPDAAQGLARVAAILGWDFSLDVLQAASGLKAENFFPALDPLLQGQILVPLERGQYAFEQGELRDLLYKQITETDRRHLHTRVAAVLEVRAGNVALSELPLEVLTAIADHYVEGDRLEKTLRYALEAGIRFTTLYAGSEAERYLEAGLAVIEADRAAVNPHIEAAYLRALGDVRRMTGQAEAAAEVYGRAVPLAEALGDRFLLGRVLTALADAWHSVDRLDAALAIAERARRVSLESGDIGGAARAALIAGRAMINVGRTGEALDSVERALEWARNAGDRHLMGEALAEMGYMQVALLPGGLDAGVAALDLSIALLNELDDKRGLIHARTMLGQARLTLGDALRAREAFTEALALSHEVGDHLEAASLAILLAQCDLECGEFQSASAGARRGVEEAIRLGSTLGLGIGMMVEAVAQCWLGRLAEAKAVMAVAFEHAGGSHHAQMEIRMVQLEGDALLALGAFDAAMAASDRLQALMIETGNLEPQGRLCTLWGEVLMRKGELTEAAEYLDNALAIAESSQTRGIRLRAMRLCARLALLNEDWERVEELAVDGLGLAQILGAKHMEADMLGIHGEWALATQAAGAASDFTAMRVIAETLQLPVMVAQAEFGQAAASPYAPDAAEKAQAAKQRLEAVFEALDAEARAEAASPLEHQRILSGNYIDFSLPRTVTRPANPLPMKPGFGGMGFGGGML